MAAGVRFYCIRNSYTMGCPPVCGDNPQALASGFLRRDGQTWYNYFNTTYMSVDLAHHKIFCAKVGKGVIIKKILFIIQSPD